MNAIPPPPLSSSFGTVRDPKTGQDIVLDSSRNWAQWFSHFFQSVFTFLGNGFFQYGPTISFTVADTTPSVAKGNRFKEVNTGATVITAFDDGTDGQEIIILFTTGNTTITDGASLQLAGGVNFVGTANDILTLILFGTVWLEKSRSVN